MSFYRFLPCLAISEPRKAVLRSIVRVFEVLPARVTANHGDVGSTARPAKRSANVSAQDDVMKENSCGAWICHSDVYPASYSWTTTLTSGHVDEHRACHRSPRTYLHMSS